MRSELILCTGKNNLVKMILIIQYQDQVVPVGYLFGNLFCIIYIIVSFETKINMKLIN